MTKHWITRRSSIVGLWAIVLLVPPNPTTAQVEPGDSVRLKLTYSRLMVVDGRALGRIDETFRFRNGDRDIAVPLDSVLQIDRWSSHHPELINRVATGTLHGSIVGSILGVGVALLYGGIAGDCSSTCGSRRGKVFIRAVGLGAASGGVAGALMGLLVSGPRWTRVWTGPSY